MPYFEDVVQELQKKYNLWLLDNFYSTEHLTEVITQTGSITKELFQVVMNTGVQENSTVKMYYDLNRFNPHYSKAFFRVNFESIADATAFVGFKKYYTDPAFNDVESHCGLLLYNGNLYLSSGNQLGVAVGYQNTLISGIDLTRDFIIQIEKNRLFSMPLPQVIPYFDTFRIISEDRVWTLKVTNSSFPPEDLTHYIVYFIRNHVNASKKMTLRHFCYLEEYAD